MYQNYSETKDQFYEEHGDFVITPEKIVLFCDGAVDQSPIGGTGPFNEPPDDPLERKRLIKSFWAIKVQIAKTQFQLYQNYLDDADWGDKECPPEAADLVSEEDKLLYLKELARRVQTAQRYVRQWHAEIVEEEEKLRSEAKTKKLTIRQKRALLERLGPGKNAVDEVEAESQSRNFEFRRAVRKVQI